MPWGKKADKKDEKDEKAPDLWAMEAGFNSPWTTKSQTDTEFVLEGRSNQSHGWLVVTVTIDRRTGNASKPVAQWNSPEMRRNEPNPKPVKIGKIRLVKGRKSKTHDI